MKTNTAFIQGQRHFLRGEYGRSIMGFGNALETGMDADKVHVPLGLAYFKNMDFAAAAAEFGHALKLDPISDHTLFLRGMALFNNVELDRALEDFSAALRLNPGRGMAYVARSLVFRALHRDTEAERDLQSAIATGGVEVELFIREYCLTPAVYGLAMTLFDVEKAPWGHTLWADRTDETQ
jgi:tetratricopeptide (TPR) repeat protein